jgi:TonB family protein
MNLALDVVAKPTLILVCAVLLSIFFRRSSASLRHAVWILAMTGAVAVPLAVALIPKFELPVLPDFTTSVTFLPVHDNPAAAVAAARHGLLPAMARMQWKVRPLFIWLAGTCLVLFRFLIGATAIRRLSKAATDVSDESWRGLMAEVSATLGVRKSVQLKFSSAPISPMTWGLMRHAVLLPSTAQEWSEERRRLVLAHELGHVKRSDALTQAFAHVVCGLYWFNPLVWYAAHRLRVEQERACDDGVLTLGTAPADYADHLMQIVRGLRNVRGLSHAALSIAQPSQLETRLVSILDSRTQRRRMSWIGASALCMFAAVLTVSIAAVRIAAAVPLPPVIVAAMKLEPPAPSSKAPVKSAPGPQRTRIGNESAVSNPAVLPPQVVESRKPIYTNEGLAAGIEGTVTLEASVDLSGNVKILRVVKSLGYGLDERAIGSVLDWKFAPATRDGVPVKVITQIDVDFKLPPPIIDPIDGSLVLRIGPGVTPPTVISRVEPSYTDKARDARFQGTVVLRALVHKDGTLIVEHVVRELGMGLDENAIDALQMWKFKPAMKDGLPVPVELNIEVNFNLK